MIYFFSGCAFFFKTFFYIADYGLDAVGKITYFPATQEIGIAFSVDYELDQLKVFD